MGVSLQAELRRDVFYATRKELSIRKFAYNKERSSPT